MLAVPPISPAVSTPSQAIDPLVKQRQELGKQILEAGQRGDLKQKAVLCIQCAHLLDKNDPKNLPNLRTVYALYLTAFNADPENEVAKTEKLARQAQLNNLGMMV